MYTEGYCILSSNGILDKDVFEDFENQLRNASPIFNSTKNDKKRLQTNLKINRKNYPFIQSIDTMVRGLNPLLTPSNWVILKSKPGCSPQSAHLDYEYSDELLEASKDPAKIPLLVLVAVMPNTKIYIWKHSQKIIRERYRGPPVPPTTIELQPGDVFVFRADMIHAGADYPEENIRIHCYLDSPHVKRNPNRTWIIQKHASDTISKHVVEANNPFGQHSESVL
jgi:hypothetical protein